MRPRLVVPASVRLGQHVSFLETAKDFPLDELVPQAAVEGLTEGVLPGTRRPAADELDPAPSGPLGHDVRDEFRPVVAADMGGDAAQRDQPLQHRDDIGRLESPGHLQVQAQPGMLIDDGEEPQGPAIRRVVLEEIQAPHVIGPRRAEAGHLSQEFPPRPMPFLGLDLQPQELPESMEGVLADVLDGVAHDFPHPVLPKARLRARPGGQEGFQALVSLAGSGRIAEAGPTPAEDPTGQPFGDLGESLQNCLEGRPALSRAQAFPRKASLRIRLASSASANSVFNRAFSFSNALRRLASGVLNPP